MNPTLTLPRPLRVAIILFIVLAAGFILKVGEDVLVPVALASLVAFVLNPLVVRLRRLGLPQMVAVLGVVGFAALLMLTALVGVSTQLKDLADEIPQHRETIEQRLLTVKRWMHGGTLDRLQNTLRGIDERTTRVAEREAGKSEASQTIASDDTSDFGARFDAWLSRMGLPNTPRDGETVTVNEEAGTDTKTTTVVTAPTSVWAYSPWYLSALDVLAMVGVVALLATFFLLQQRDIRDRIVSVAGRGALATTTKALGDAGSRISKYLFMQFVINATYGLAVAIGLLLTGVPYAVLWGFVAALFRYVPYVGPWVAALLPIGVTFIMDDGWFKPGVVVALFIVLELVSNNVMEPILYGQSGGLSQVAVILAAVFWAWLWGPVGLVLATPLTVCLVVLGRHIPGMRMFDQLLGDTLQVGEPVRLYQRLLARADDDAQDLVEEFLEKHTPVELCDAMLMPAVEYAHHDSTTGQLDEHDMEWIRRSIGGIIDELEEEAATKSVTEKKDPNAVEETDGRPLVVGVAAQSADEVTMLRAVEYAVRDLDCRFEVLSDDLLFAERIERVAELAPLAVCISAMSPGDFSPARQLCKRIRARLPDVKVFVGRWSASEDSPRNPLLTQAGADQVTTSMAKLHAAVRSAVQVHKAKQAQPAKSAKRDSAA